MALKRLLCALVALSFILAGTPALAAPGGPCPMERTEQAHNMPQSEISMDHCQDCPETAKAQTGKVHKKNGCCDDAACNAKCAMIGFSASLLIPSSVFQWSVLPALKRPEALSHLPLSSQSRKTPERPPKSLS